MTEYQRLQKIMDEIEEESIRRSARECSEHEYIFHIGVSIGLNYASLIVQKEIEAIRNDR